MREPQIADIEAKERESVWYYNTGDYNRKDGYYFHVTNSNLSLVPDHFFRKATLKIQSALELLNWLKLKVRCLRRVKIINARV